MALIVEDGTGLINSNSYASIAEADAYFLDRANTVWAALLTPAKTAALILAADYLRRTYGTLWAGYRRTGLQRMDWPRYAVPMPLAYVPYANAALPGYYPETSVPEEIKNAQIELAFLSATSVALDPALGPPVIEETVGPITTKYATGARQTTVFPFIENMLLPFLISNKSFPIYRG